MPTLNVVVASTRPGRVGPKIADWFVGRAKDHGGFDVRLVDLAEVGLPLMEEPEHPITGNYANPRTREWSAAVGAADAQVIVLPEYNYGLAAPLKNAIDHLFWEWAYLPTGFVSYGMGAAGANATAMLRQVIAPLKMVPAMPAVTISLREQLDEQRELKVADWMNTTATELLNELDALSGALGGLRDKTRQARATA